MNSRIASPAQIVGVLVAWLTLKYATALAWVFQVGAFGDTDYYFRSVRAALQDGSVADQLREYPTPVAWILQVPYLLGGHDEEAYRSLFMVGISVLDLAFVALLLWRLGVLAALAWLLLTTLAGQLALLRFDLVPAVLAASGLLLVLSGRTTSAGPVLALGTASKVWPVLFAPLLFSEPRARLRALLSFAATGAALVAVSVLGAGVPRLLSPLTYQAERGLQIEAVAATLPMVSWRTDAAYTVSYSPFKAFEITGPGVDVMLRTAATASAVAIVVGLGLLVAWYLRGCPREPAGYLAVAMVLLFVVTSRAYSPQYTLWLAALAVVLFGVGLDGREFRFWPAVVVLGWTVVLMLLTTAVYPTYYGAVTSRNDDTRFAVALLVTRNALALGLLAFVLAVTVNGLVRAPRRRRRS